MRLIACIAFALLVHYSGHTQQHSLEATLEVSRFQASDKAYAEIFLYIIGNTVVRDTSGHGSVKCTYFIYRDSQLITGDKYTLVSAGVQDFMDVKRQYFAPGRYLLTMELVDFADSTNALSLERPFEIAGPDNGVGVSDIQLLSKASSTTANDIWTKHSAQCFPLPYNYYHKGYDELTLYMEIYGVDVAAPDGAYVRFSISALNSPEKTLMQNARRLQQSAVIPIVHRIDLQGLGSGEYVLTADVLKRNNELLTSRTVSFTRSNPEADRLLVQVGKGLFARSFTEPMSADSVIYALKALAPVVSPTEVEVLNFLIKKGEIENQKRFIHDYWVARNAQDPERVYTEYMAVVHAVDQLFHSGLGHGFETDRGYIFLRYGAPDDKVAVEDEPSAPPYEIWIYNYLPQTRQSDVKFLFYDPSLSNHFELLHSTADGELYNRRWENMLYGDALSESGPGDFINATPVESNFHRRAREYFETF